MISDLSTFIQFLAAIYVTITLDSLLFKRFWSPDYFNMVVSSINRIGFQNSSNIQKKIERNIRQKASQLEETSRKRGAYMLFICVLLLVYVGFECKINTMNTYQLRTHYFPISLSQFYLFIIYCNINRFFKKWIWVFGHLIITILFFIVGNILISNNEVTNYIASICFIDCTKILLAIILVIPIFYQLYINWVYSTAYKCYLEDALFKESQLYKQAKNALEKGDKKLRPTEYLKVFSDLFFDSNSKDQHITGLNNYLYQRIINISSVPPSFNIIKSYYKKKEYKKEDGRLNDDVQLEDENTSVNNNCSTLQIEDIYNDYIKIIPRPKLTEFCKKNDYPESELRSYMKQIANSKKKL